MRELDLESYVGAAADQLARQGHEAAANDRDRLRDACAIAQEKAQTLTELWPLIGFLFGPPVEDERAWAKVMKPSVAVALERSLALLRSVDPFDDPPSRPS